MESFPQHEGNSKEAKDLQTTLEAYELQAQLFISRKSWDDVIRVYRAALVLQPNDAALHIKMGHAYESKGRGEQVLSALILAFQSYRQAVLLNPLDQKSHDAFLAIAVHLNRLEDLLTDYQQFIKNDPQNKLYYQTLKKIQTLFLLKTDSKTQKKREVPKGYRLINMGVPAFILLSLGISFFLKWVQPFPNSLIISPIFFKASIFLAIAFFAYKVYLYFASS